MRVRPEWFGALVSFERPAAVVAVNRPLARLLGVRTSRWQGDDPGRLSAPTEVHVVLSRRCESACTNCYVAATPHGEVLDPGRARRILDNLAARGVFHAALGGGEALELPHLFDLAEHARRAGIVPNLSTSGRGLDAETARRCRIFGRINVSVDGIGEGYREARGHDGFAEARAALRLLRAERRGVGVNCVVTRRSFERLEEVVRFARAERLDEVELLRFKPVGRGAARRGLDLSADQARALYPLVRRLSLRHRVRVKLDCSFAPMVFAHDPSPAAARFFGVVGCQGGNLLGSVMPDGTLRGCSFAGPAEADASDRGALGKAMESGFASFRGFAARAPEPCRSCRWLSLCNGGCRAVSAHAGDWWAPDPGCPRVAR